MTSGKAQKSDLSLKLEEGKEYNQKTESKATLIEEINRQKINMVMTIKGISTIGRADKDAYIESNGMPLKYDLTGSMLSEYKVDKNTRWIIEAKINQEIKGDAYIKENPQMPDGIKIPIIMINDMVITN